MEALFSELTVWHWLALGIVLFGIEMMLGTFDLLMIAIAAFAAALFAAVTGDAFGWQAQVLVFFIASLALFVLGRTVLSGMRKNIPEHPTLNRRMDGLVGESGTATIDFAGNDGQVKIGDTVWGAHASGGETIKSGDLVRVESVKGTQVVVRKA